MGHRILDLLPKYGAHGLTSQAPGDMVNPSFYSEAEPALAAGQSQPVHGRNSPGLSLKMITAEYSWALVEREGGRDRKSWM